MASMHRPLSVLLVSPAPHVPGGVAAFARTMHSYLASSHVVPLYIGSGPEKNRNIFMRGGHALAKTLTLLRLALTGKVDVVHLNPSLNSKSLMRDGVFLLALRIIRFRNVIVYFHGWDGKTEQYLRCHSLLRKIFSGLLNDARRVLVLSPAFAAALADMGVKPELVALASAMFDGAVIPSAKHAPSGRCSILFMSRFDKRKGMYELLDAFAHIASDFPNVDLVFAGSGAEEERLRAAARSSGVEERVRFAGYVSGMQKTALLQQCSIFALPTTYPEGMPVALLEAMAAGKPVLTARAGGISRYVRDPENGIVLEQVTAGAIEAGLRRLLTDGEYCAQAGARNAQSAWEKFEAKSIAAQMEKMYHEACG